MKTMVRMGVVGPFTFWNMEEDGREWTEASFSKPGDPPHEVWESVGVWKRGRLVNLMEPPTNFKAHFENGSLVEVSL